MKNKLYRLFVMIAFGLALSCADPNLDPLLSDKVKKGTLLALRGTQLANIYVYGGYDCGGGDAFYYNSVTGKEVFEFEVAFLAEDQNTLGSIECFVNKIQYSDIETKEGKTTTKVPLGITKQAGDFALAEGEKYKKVTVSIPINTIMSKLGVDPKTPAGQKTLFDTYGEVGIVILTDLTLADGSKITADELVAPGLQASDVFYPAQKLNYCLLDVDDYNPVPIIYYTSQYNTNSARTDNKPTGTLLTTATYAAVALTTKFSVSKLPMKEGRLDTILIIYDNADEITNTPSVSLSIRSPNITLGNVGKVGSVEKITKAQAVRYGLYSDVTKGEAAKNAFYIIYTAPAGYTGPVLLTILGAQASVSGTTLTQNSKSYDIPVDNTAPIPIMTTIFTNAAGIFPLRIGKGQSTLISAKFNEPVDISKASIDVRGQNLDTIGFQTFTLSADKLTMSYPYKFEDSEAPYATHGQLTISVKGIKDLAGNDFLFSNGSTSIVSKEWLTCDLVAPNAPLVSVGTTTYDYGNQLYITGIADDKGTKDLTNALYRSSTTGTIYYIAVKRGAVPGQKTGGGFDISTSLGSFALGSFVASSSAQYIPFIQNGDLDLYFYFMNSSGNTSLNTTAPLQITMK